MQEIPHPVPAGRNAMIQNARYVHTNIISRDWERLARFYETVFGCIRVLPGRDMSGEWIEKGTGVRGAHVHGAHLRLPGYDERGPTLEIFQYNIGTAGTLKPVNESGLAHIAFLMENVESALSEVLANGGSRLTEVVTKEIAGVGLLTFVYARDPDGNILELQSWTR
jgi:catechol 2,3-dioxygenase-like lactoylglutathione lyase family enzyme